MRNICFYDKLQEIAQYDVESWVDGQIATMGRSDNTTWSFPDRMELSRHHLSIRKLNDEIYLRDEQSSNGTYFNGERMTHAIRMRAGVTYQIGNLTFFLEGAKGSPADEEVDCSSVFPEEIAFAALETGYIPSAPVIAEVTPFTIEPEAVEEEVEEVVITPHFSLQPEVEEEEEIAIEAPIAAPFSLQPEVVEEVEELVIVAPPTTPALPPTAAGSVKPFIPIPRAPAGGIPCDFALQVRTLDGYDDIAIGQKLYLEIFSEVPCQILIFCKEQNGHASLLYPSKKVVQQIIPAQTWTPLPNPQSPMFEFEIEGPAGVDEIQVIAKKQSSARMNIKSAKNPKEEAPEQVYWSYAHLKIEVFEQS